MKFPNVIIHQSVQNLTTSIIKDIDFVLEYAMVNSELNVFNCKFRITEAVSDFKIIFKVDIITNKGNWAFLNRMSKLEKNPYNKDKRINGGFNGIELNVLLTRAYQEDLLAIKLGDK